MARRAGVEPDVILAHWHDRRVSLKDTIVSRVLQVAPVPDTGSLRGDLQALADMVAESVATPQGRKWLHRMLPHMLDADLGMIGPDALESRLNALHSILKRAEEREELRDGVDCTGAVRMFAAASTFDVVFRNTPIRTEYADLVLDIFIRGITRDPG